MSVLAALLEFLWVIGGPVIDDRLLPAWEALIGEEYRERAAATVSVIVAGMLPPEIDAAWVRELRWIVIAAYLVHELAHAEQDRQARKRPDIRYA